MTVATLAVVQGKHDSQSKQTMYEGHGLRPNSNLIRVLDVQPVPKDATEDTPVECSLRVINLDRNPKFTALSYVWGDPNHKRSIVCDGTLVEVTKNCYSALWHLSKKLQGLIIWVDAICIDQNDKNKEKEWQIPLMGEIYTKARQVYVWLGEGDETSDKVMAYLSSGGLRAYIEPMPEEPPRCRIYAAALRSLTRASFEYSPSLPSRTRRCPVNVHDYWRQYAWNDFVHVFDRPWKSRIWTYQEILLASHPVIVCGTRHVDWSDFEWTLLLLRSTLGYFPSAHTAWENIAFDRSRLSSTIRPAEPNLLYDLQKYDTIINRFLSARRVLRVTFFCLVLACLTASVHIAVVSILSVQHPEWEIQLHIPTGLDTVLIQASVVCILWLLLWVRFEVLRKYHSCQNNFNEIMSDDLVGALYRRAATDPRDIAYGIWAILRIRGASGLPEPTYDTDIESQIPLLYRQLTVHLMQVTNNLRILHVAAARRLPGAPSWVPDWSTFKRNTWLDIPCFPGTALPGLNLGISSEAQKKERAQQRISIDPTHGVLTVLARDTGAICGCVSFYPTSRTFEIDERHAHMENLRAMLQWAEWVEHVNTQIFAIVYMPLAPELTPLSAEVTWPSWVDRLKWEKTLFKQREDSLNTYLTRWMDGAEVPRWFHEFMATQIWMCTLLAELKRKICYVSFSAEPGKFYLLACSEETQVADRVLSVCGLPGAIVVRKRNKWDNSVEIISPAIPHGHGAAFKPERTNELLEYHIH